MIWVVDAWELISKYCIAEAQLVLQKRHLRIWILVMIFQKSIAFREASGHPFANMILINVTSKRNFFQTFMKMNKEVDIQTRSRMRLKNFGKFGIINKSYSCLA